MQQRRFFVAIAVGLAFGIALASEARPPDPADWRARLSGQDRGRLRDWRRIWGRALADARARGAASQIAAEGPLLAPDAALDMEAPPAGAYRCRTLKIGSANEDGLAFVSYPWLGCRIDGDRFVKLTGSQRPAGDLHRDEAGRLVFVGAMSLADEVGALPYGRDRERDMVGLIERIGPRRWRLVIPAPRWESLLDVIELVPAG